MILIAVVSVLAPLAKASTVNSSTIATDSDIASVSLATSGGQKLIEDPFVKRIILYVTRPADGSGIGLVIANSDPRPQSSWTTPWKSSAPVYGYKRPPQYSQPPTCST